MSRRTTKRAGEGLSSCAVLARNCTRKKHDRLFNCLVEGVGGKRGYSELSRAIEYGGAASYMIFLAGQANR